MGQLRKVHLCSLIDHSIFKVFLDYVILDETDIFCRFKKWTFVRQIIR